MEDAPLDMTQVSRYRGLINTVKNRVIQRIPPAVMFRTLAGFGVTTARFEAAEPLTQQLLLEIGVYATRIAGKSAFDRLRRRQELDDEATYVLDCLERARFRLVVIDRPGPTHTTWAHDAVTEEAMRLYSIDLHERAAAGRSFFARIVPFEDYAMPLGLLVFYETAPGQEGLDDLIQMWRADPEGYELADMVRNAQLQAVVVLKQAAGR